MIQGTGSAAFLSLCAKRPILHKLVLHRGFGRFSGTKLCPLQRFEVHKVLIFCFTISWTFSGVEIFVEVSIEDNVVFNTCFQATIRCKTKLR